MLLVGKGGMGCTLRISFKWPREAQREDKTPTKKNQDNEKQPPPRDGRAAERTKLYFVDSGIWRRRRSRSCLIGLARGSLPLCQMQSSAVRGLVFISAFFSLVLPFLSSSPTLPIDSASQYKSPRAISGVIGLSVGSSPVSITELAIQRCGDYAS